MDISKLLGKLYQKLLSQKTKERSERVILWIALVSFLIHLLMIGLIHFNILNTQLSLVYANAPPPACDFISGLCPSNLGGSNKSRRVQLPFSNPFNCGKARK
jgi:hypothetical protein